MNFCLSVDKKSTSEIMDKFLIEKLELNSKSLVNKYISISEKLSRIEFINYVRFSFNKLTEEERKLIYWTYFDKEDNYDDRFIANSLGFSLGYYYMKKRKL